MKLFITDNRALYQLDNSPYKLLFQNCYFKESEGFDKGMIERLNYSNNDLDFRAATMMFPEIYALIDQLSGDEIRPNRYIQTRKKKDQTFTLLFPFAMKYILAKHQLLISLKSLFELHMGTDFSEVNIQLSAVFKLAEKEMKTMPRLANLSIVFREDKASLKFKTLKFIKNYLYELYHWMYSINFQIQKPKSNNGRHILLVTYNVSTVLKLLETFFELIKNNKAFHLSIIQIDAGLKMEHAISANHLECKNIRVYKFQDFRKGCFYSNNSIFDSLEKVDKSYLLFKENNLLENINLHYEWMNNSIEKLNPDVCLYDNQTEMGRLFSDVARYQKKPSVCVEYSLTFDDPFLKQNVHFTSRACINDYTANNYIKNGDPTNQYSVIGFCKLDALKDVRIDKLAFFAKHGFDLNRKTLFFASTWSSENKIFEEEKKVMAKELSEICFKNNWNLIIKKHPSEFDAIVEEALKSNPLQNQKVFSHADLPLGEAVLLCDFMCCQSSSAVLEAIYFGKPFCYLSKAEVGAIANYSILSLNDSIPTFTNVESFEYFIKNVFAGNEALFSKDSILKRQEKFLYKTDGQASKRLLEILTTINFVE